MVLCAWKKKKQCSRHEQVTGGTQAHGQNYWWFQAFSTGISNMQHLLSHRHQVCAWNKKNIFGGHEHNVSMDKPSNNSSERIKTFIHPHGSCPITLSSVTAWITKRTIDLKMALIPIPSKPNFWFCIWNMLQEFGPGMLGSNVHFCTEASLPKPQMDSQELNSQWCNFSKQNPLLAVLHWRVNSTPTSIHCFRISLPKDWQRFYNEVLSVEDITPNHTTCWWARFMWGSKRGTDTTSAECSFLMLIDIKRNELVKKGTWTSLQEFYTNIYINKD